MKGTATLRSLLLLLVLAVAATFARGAGHRAAVVATPRPAGAIAATPAPVVAQQVATFIPSRTHAPRTSPTVTARTAAPAEAGMWIYKDPETGTIGPRPVGAEPASAINPLNDSDAGLVQVQLPDGSYMVDLQGRFQDYYVLEMTPSGQRVVKCVQNPKEARASSAVAPQPEDR